MTNILYKLSFSMLCLTLALVSSAWGDASAKSVTVIGTSEIRDKNVAKARDQAVTNALAAAAETAALEIFPPEVFANNFKKLTELLSGMGSRSVQNYKILAESQIGKTYRIMISATVSTRRLEEEKEQLMRTAQPEPPAMKPEPRYPGPESRESSLPKILFLISEKSLEDRSPGYWWGENSEPPEAFSERTMTLAMEKKGFTVITHGYVSSGAKKTVTYRADLDNKEAISIGKRLQADVVVVGTSIVYKVLTTQERSRSFSGTVSARAIRTDTGEEIASILKTAVKVDVDETVGSRNALSAAGTLAGGELSSRIKKAWQKPFQETTMTRGDDLSPKKEKSADAIEIVVRGTNHLGNFVKFRRTLAETQGVEGIQISEMKANEAIIHVDFQGDARSLADVLASDTFELFSVKLYDVAGDIIRLELVPR
ncbi:hypothetical protein QUF80_23545 [Desulfococcaceae bacterium HSG8]|nr:hypothetical protein [Desulfococcaceae bacterium HSG8]